MAGYPQPNIASTTFLHVQALMTPASTGFFAKAKCDAKKTRTCPTKRAFASINQCGQHMPASFPDFFLSKAMTVKLNPKDARNRLVAMLNAQSGQWKKEAVPFLDH